MSESISLESIVKNIEAYCNVLSNPRHFSPEVSRYELARMMRQDVIEQLHFNKGEFTGYYNFYRQNFFPRLNQRGTTYDGRRI